MKLKSTEDIALLREGGKRLASVVDHVAALVRPGVTAAELNQAAEAQIASLDAVPSFKGYNGFPAAACISVNEQVVHGIPREDTVLHDGDIVGIDIGIIYKKLFTDMARTVAVGTITAPVQQLLDSTRHALELGIAQAQPGHTIGDIGHAIDTYGQELGYGVVRQLVGHGVGYQVHEPPQVPNYGQPGTGEKLAVGMVLALEPMFNMGSAGIITLNDGWTIISADKSLSAHFEHTIAILDDGPEILTQ